MALASTPKEFPKFAQIDVDDDYVDCPYCGARREHTVNQFKRDTPRIAIECDNCGKTYNVDRVYMG